MDFPRRSACFYTENGAGPSARTRKAETTTSRFIFLWIEFNAAYASDLSEWANYPKKSLFIGFILKLVELDRDDARGM